MSNLFIVSNTFVTEKREEEEDNFFELIVAQDLPTLSNSNSTQQMWTSSQNKVLGSGDQKINRKN